SKVTRILPGMQAAFVDIGMDRAAFLHASDILGRVHAAGDTAPAGNRGSADPGGPPPGISELLRDGQEVVVQVVKDPLGTKGARVTTHLTLTARSLVYMPYSKHIGISQKIEDDAERERLVGSLQVASH